MVPVNLDVFAGVVRQVAVRVDRYEIQSFIDGGLMTIYDAPWPGFTPDLMSICLVTAIQAKGGAHPY